MIDVTTIWGLRPRGFLFEMIVYNYYSLDLIHIQRIGGLVVRICRLFHKPEFTNFECR